MQKFWKLDNNIKAYRRLHNLSQKEFGDKIGLGLANTRLLERGKYNPRMSTVYEIAALFNIPIEEVFFERDNRPPIRFDLNSWDA